MTSSLKGVIALLAACAALSGQSPGRGSQTAATQVDIVALKARIAKLEKAVDDSEAYAAKTYYEFLKFKSAMTNDVALLDPATPGAYARLDSDVGPLLLSFRKADPYLDGVKVAIQIGNPTSAEIIGGDLFVAWTSRYVEGGPLSRREWLLSKRAQKTSFTTRLSSGRWTDVEIILPATRPENFGYLEVQLKTTSISLAMPR